jgi:hypothetical protein
MVNESSGMASSNSSKMYHQPLNPFRTQPSHPRESDVLANPILRTCYVFAVGTLMICVSLVAYSTYIHLPSANNDSTLATGPNRLAVVQSATDLKILQPEIRSRTISLINDISNTIRTAATAQIPSLQGTEKLSPPLANVRSKDYGRDQDDADKEEALSYHHDDEVDELRGHDLDDAEELRPAEVHAKMLGQTKDQVKLEIDQERYSDHAFGVDQDDTNEGAASTNHLDSLEEPPLDPKVIVLPRKGEVENIALISGANPSNITSTLGSDSDTQRDDIPKVDIQKIGETRENQYLRRKSNPIVIAAEN